MNMVQYNIISLVFTWFQLANLWLTFSIVIDLLPNLTDHPFYMFGSQIAVRLHTLYSCACAEIDPDALGQFWAEVVVHGFPRVTICARLR
jgi:hypothetical protein